MSKQKETQKSNDCIKASDILSPELKAFYESHNVDVDLVAEMDDDATAVRYIRLNPRFNATETITLLEKELILQQQQQQRNDDDTAELATKQPTKTALATTKPRPIPWLKNGFGFYAIPATTKLQHLTSFQSGRVYGMDVSSGAAVAVLMTSQFDKEDPTNETRPIRRVLDLCCAPGLKLCMLADICVPDDDNMKKVLSPNNNATVVVGVDISESRLALCKKIVKKYHVDAQASSSSPSLSIANNTTIQIYHGNGVTFGTGAQLVFDSQVAKEEVGGSKRKRMNKSARARERKRLKQVMLDEQQQLKDKTDHGSSNNFESPSSSLLYDRVLVDAECSTDGSLKHVQQQVKKQQQQQQSNSNEDHQMKTKMIENLQLTNKQQLEDLVELQRGLLVSGYRNLQRGGLLVYSTCSLSTAQNEGVVQSLLDAEKDAYLIPLEFSSSNDDAGTIDFIREGSIKGTIRFVPSNSDDSSFSGGGFFVAKIGKK